MSGRTNLVFIILLLISCSAIADTHWTLDNSKSNMYFVSVKNTSIAETHTFKTLTGSIDASGKVNVSINLDSIESLIPIRNERMRELLFNTKAFPEAIITATPDFKKIKQIKSGTSQAMTTEFTINLHGQSQTMSAEVQVTRLSENIIQVSQVKPLLIQASSFKLVEGVKKLQEIAGLSSIGAVVPVTFHLEFKK